MAASVNYDDIDDLAEALKRVPAFAIATYKRAMLEALKTLQGEVQEYPPATEANRPGRWSVKTHRPMGYYERGQGTWYPVKTKRTITVTRSSKSQGQVLLSAKMQKIMQIVGYKLSRTSELLGRSWARRVERVENSIVGEIGNNASYAQFVQGDEQATFHRARGWITLQDGITVAMPAIITLFDRANDDIIAEAAKSSGGSGAGGTPTP